MISRAVVLLPQPVSPTRPSVSPRRDVEVDPVDRLHGADFFLHDDAARQREVLDQAAHLHERICVPAASHRRRHSPVEEAPAPNASCGRRLVLAHRSRRLLLLGQVDRGKRLVGHASGAQLCPQAPARVGLQQTRDVVVGLAGDRLQLRVDARMRGCA